MSSNCSPTCGICKGHREDVELVLVLGVIEQDPSLALAAPHVGEQLLDISGIRRSIAIRLLEAVVVWHL